MQGVSKKKTNFYLATVFTFLDFHRTISNLIKTSQAFHFLCRRKRLVIQYVHLLIIFAYPLTCTNAR